MRKYLQSQGVTFDPETVQVLCVALDEAWAAARRNGVLLKLDGEPPQARRIMARRIVDLARTGERNVVKLRDEALLQLMEAAEQSAA